MKKKDSFSLRKYKIGTVSVLLGALFLFGGAQSVAADSIESDTTISQIESIAPITDVSADEVELATSKIEDTDVEAVSQEGTIAFVGEENLVQTTSPAEVDEPVFLTEETTETSNSFVSASQEATLVSTEIDAPLNIDSNTIITVPGVWDSGYKGEGMVVAVIDSGLDIEHDVLRISDISTAKYKSEEEIEAAKQAAGITYGEWFNEKVIFGYNYVDVNTVLKEEDKRSHGMHVTSIATGNPTEPVAGQLMYGVAPEAQVMFMRVFSDIKSTTGEALYVQAIEDAVKLGADSINLSLGGANGSVINMSEVVTAAIEAARRAGVSVVIAAGNDGTFGSGHSLPSADNPDYGLVASPSTARDALSVASYNNTTVASKVMTIVGLEDDADLNYGKSSFDNPDKSAVKFEIGKEYDYVFVGLGETQDFENVDVNGKLALIKRGAITFSDKIANATAAGAAGVVIYNNRPGEANIPMALDETAIAIPSVFIPFEFGEALATNAYKILFNNEVDIQPNPAAGLISDFSSWGLSADGELKPDLAAPGGSIYAAINDNEYGNMQGTSMAAPHVAGAAVLVKQYLQEVYPSKTPQEIEALIKHLLMSTAKAHVNVDTQAYTSPRQQGAGIVDTASAIATGLYLTGEDGYSSITLGNVEDQFVFSVTLHNITDEEKTLDYSTQLNTDTVEEGHITLTPRLLKEIPGGSVTVQPHSSTTLQIAVDASDFTDELTSLMKNGYYLEGFVRFTDTVDGADIVSIPYVGFRGEFQNLPVVEEPIYNLVADGNGGFYFEPVEDNPLDISSSQHATSLITSSSELIYSTNKRTESSRKVLGTFKNEEGRFVLELDETGQPRLAISPNNDGNQDSLIFKGVFLRNYSNLVASVYAATDTERTTPLWTSVPQEGSKNFYSGNSSRPKSRTIYATEWTGVDQNGERLQDGKYQYVLTYTSEVVGSDVQIMVFDVIIDRESPVITTATYDESTFTFAPRPAIEKGESGILRDQVFYLVAEDGITTIPSLLSNGDVKVVDNKVFIAKNEDGTFTLPLDLADLSAFYYTVEDYAGNVSYAKVEHLISIGNDKGLVTVNVVDKDTETVAPIVFAYSVTDESGNVVTELPRYATDDNTLKLPFGTYTIELFLYDTEWSSIAGETKFEVTINEENSIETVSFYVQMKEKSDVVIDIDRLLPVGSAIALKTADGRVIQIPNARYSKTDYGKTVPVGDYTIVPSLPEGYEFLEELEITVTKGQVNLKQLTLISKVALIDLLATLTNLSETARYYNADDSLRVSYDETLEVAESVLVSKQHQSEIDAIVAQLLAAKDALNGQETDTQSLLKELAGYPEVQSTPAYYNATEVKQIAYDTLVRSAQLLLEQVPLTQKVVDQTLFDLLAAKSTLDGQETNTQSLLQELATYPEVQSTPVYYNASEEKRTAYDSVVRTAQLVLTQSPLTQELVNHTLSEIVTVKSHLDGQQTDIRALRNAISVADRLKATDARYLNASETVKVAYDRAIKAAKQLVESDNVKQENVDRVLADLMESQEALDGIAAPSTESTQSGSSTTIDSNVNVSSPPIQTEVTEEKVASITHENGSQVGAVKVSPVISVTSTPSSSTDKKGQTNPVSSEKEVLKQAEKAGSLSPDSSTTQLPKTGEKQVGFVVGFVLLFVGMVVSKKQEREE